MPQSHRFVKDVKRTPGCSALLMCLMAVSICAETRQTNQEPTTERVTIESGEWKIVGDLVLPRSMAPVAVVIMLNKAAGDRTAYIGLAEQLTRYGMGSLRIDLRGHGDSTNRGRFVPAEGTVILRDTERDVAAAHEWLRRDKRVDPRRIGFVGASYSGEAMMQAARTSGYAAAYVGLSPGSLSDESIAAIDREHLIWLLVVSRHERYLTEVAQTLRERSRSAEFLELSGTAHATDLFKAHPDLAERIALWFRYKLAPAR